MIPRLDEFTFKELEELQGAVLFRISYIELTYDDKEHSKEKEALELWRVQIRTAMVEVQFRENIASN